MAFDVDGIFTDGSLYYSADGDSLKVFNILDGLGLKLYRKRGYKPPLLQVERPRWWSSAH